MKAEEFRSYFPYLSQESPVVYFDNAATSQRPACVIEALRESLVSHNANTHRAVHRLSAEATEAYEASRDAVKDFINAPSREECIFTSGTTASINLVAYSFCQAFVGPGDEIIVGEAEHHSDFVPWQLAAQRTGARLVYWKAEDDGSYDLEVLKGLFTERTRLVCVAHASNVLGVVNPVKDIVSLCHSVEVPCLVDGAQGAVHCTIDIQDMDCDFYAFSAHKIFGPTGVGVLYGKRKWLEQMPPFLAGGEMVGTVSLEHTDYAPLPLKFEAGTPDFNSVAALKPALELADLAKNDAQLNSELESTSHWLCDALQSVPGLKIYGRTGRGILRLPVFSFTIDGVHHEDLAILLDRMNVAVRSGQMCAEPLMRHFSVTGMLRASLLWYNTGAEAEHFVKSLEKAVRMLK